ncbi:MAG: acyltransferase family protein [Coriobacteriaceae bacterium]|nr:acyltransferase family protein [Coriobacteriaceae bacterium]
MAAERSAYIDNIKGILICLVVAGHMLITFTTLTDSKAILALTNFIYTFHMPLFLFCSGLFAARSFKDGRGFRLDNVLLYLLLFVLFYTAAYCEDLLLGNARTYNPFEVSSGAWYLLTLGCFVACTPLLAKLRWPVALVGSLVLSVGCCLFVDDPNLLANARFFTYLPVYAVGFYLESGAVLSWRKRFDERGRPFRWSLIFTAAVVLVLYFLLLYGVPDDISLMIRRLCTGANTLPALQKTYPLSAGVYALLRLASYLLIALISIAILVITPSRHSFLSTVGERSLQVYIVHLLLYYAWQRFGLPEAMLSIGAWVGIVFPFVIGVLTAFLLALPAFPNKWVAALRRLCARAMPRTEHEPRHLKEG